MHIIDKALNWSPFRSVAKNSKQCDEGHGFALLLKCVCVFFFFNCKTMLLANWM